MKKNIFAIVLMVLLVSGCQKASELISAPTPTPTIPVATTVPVATTKPSEPVNKIAISDNLKMTNEWTLIGDYDISLTGGKTKDRVILGTSAKQKNGEILWDDSQYWTVAVLNDSGAYNLFSQRMSGQVYIEVGEVFINGLATPVVTAYIFGGTEREIRNYIYSQGFFEEKIVYTTKDFSTGGINSLYSTLPESEAK